MRPIRIFIISDSLLFVRGLENLLAYEPGVEIIGDDLTISHALKQIETEAPDVVILGSSNYNHQAASEELTLLKAKPGIKVISLNLQSNDLFTYCVTRRLVTSVTDLIEAIEGDTSSAQG
jgi:DNA-binding NarL/FixJ family response regulator